MVTVYTDKNKMKENAKIILDNEAFFYNNVLKYEKITKEDEEVIKEIDKAVVMKESKSNDYNANWLIETPFGVSTIDHLSTGCKTVINFLHIYNKKGIALDITECGYNALEVLFTHYEKLNSSIPLILRHSNYLYKCSKRNYIINGKIAEELV